MVGLRVYMTRAIWRSAVSSHDTNVGTNIGSTGSVSVPQSQGDTEPTYALTGITRRHVEALRSILERTTAQTSAEVEARVIIGATLDKITTL